MTDFLNSRETAKILRYSEKYFIENYEAIGVPFVKLPSGKVLFEKQAILDWIDEYRYD